MTHVMFLGEGLSDAAPMGLTVGAWHLHPTAARRGLHDAAPTGLSVFERRREPTAVRRGLQDVARYAGCRVLLQASESPVVNPGYGRLTNHHAIEIHSDWSSAGVCGQRNRAEGNHHSASQGNRRGAGESGDGD